MIKKCKVKGCIKTIKYNNLSLCSMHGARWYRTGRLDLKSRKEKFAERYTINEVTGCWNWIGYKNRDGYGRFNAAMKTELAHRAVYEEYIGEIPHEMILCHKCDNPSCVNPHHLFIGSHRDNVHDSIKKGRRNHSHLQAERHPMAKLTKSDVIEIRALAANDSDLLDIANKHGVCISTIRNVVNKKTWRKI